MQLCVGWRPSMEILIELHERDTFPFHRVSNNKYWLSVLLRLLECHYDLSHIMTINLIHLPSKSFHFLTDWINMHDILYHPALLDLVIIKNRHKVWNAEMSCCHQSLVVASFLEFSIAKDAVCLVGLFVYFPC